jgi:AbrB family looped-hinge helix DNA binding protein
MNVKVAERGQITIPKILRERLDVRPGTVLEFKEDQGKLVPLKLQLWIQLISFMENLEPVAEPMISCGSFVVIRDHSK